MTCRIRSIVFSLVSALCLLAPGCGPALVKVKGAVVKSDKPLTSVGDPPTVIFYPILENNSSQSFDYYVAKTRRDGSFEVPGVRGKGIPPGKYRIGVALPAGKNGSDRLNGAYAGNASPFVRNVTGAEDVILDLDRP